MELFSLLGKISIDANKANDEIESTTKNAETSSDKMMSAFKKLGGVVATAFSVNAIKDFGLACVEAAANQQAMASQFSQVFGDNESQAAASLSSIADETGIVENRMRGSYTQIAAFAKTTGMETSDSLELANRAMVAVADSAAFYDRSLEDVTDSLQSFLKGNYENDAALGLSCTETTRNAAANALYGKSFNELSESQKQLTLLQMVEDANAASGALGQAARESDTWTNQTGNLKQAWEDFQAVLGDAVLPYAVEVLGWLQDKVQFLKEKAEELKPWIDAVVQGFKDFGDWCSDHVEILGAIGAVIGIITTALFLQSAQQTISAGVQSVKAAMNAVEEASLWGLFKAQMATLAPYLLIAAAIAAVIAIGVLLYKNWDTIKEKITELAANLKEKWEAIKTAISEKVAAIKQAVVDKFQALKNGVQEKIEAVKQKAQEIFQAIYDNTIGKVVNLVSEAGQHFEELKSNITKPIEDAKAFIGGIVDDITGFFTGMKLELPNIKLPHFSVTGSLSISPPSVPHLSIEWYKKAMDEPYMFTEPTLFNYNPLTGSAKGAGEMGDEVMIGKNTMLGMIQQAVTSENGALAQRVEQIIDMLSQFFPDALNAMNQTMVLDTGVLVAQTAPAMDAELGKIQFRKGRGR